MIADDDLQSFITNVDKIAHIVANIDLVADDDLRSFFIANKDI